MSLRTKRKYLVAGAVGALICASMSSASAHNDKLRTVAEFNGPRGVASVGEGRTVVTDSDGNFSLVKEWRYRGKSKTKVFKLGSLSPGFGAAVDDGPYGSLFLLTGGGEPGTGAATLYKWKSGYAAPKAVADIAAYQATDHDPYNQEGDPAETNPFGVAALKDGSVLVADAAGNDLLRVYKSGKVKTVARLKPRVVEVPEGLPATDPDGNPLPPAGTPIPAEGVATSVTVGADGYWYVGELRGFPATPGSSEIWRIKPGSKNAVCDPENPYKGACTRYADGLTSIVDLAADRKGNIYALSLSKMSWLSMELGVPGAEVGGLFKISKKSKHHSKKHGVVIREIAKDKLIMPGGVDVSRSGKVYVTGPVFGPGALSKIG